jgi:hypothetical protein
MRRIHTGKRFSFLIGAAACFQVTMTLACAQTQDWEKAAGGHLEFEVA